MLKSIHECYNWLAVKLPAIEKAFKIAKMATVFGFSDDDVWVLQHHFISDRVGTDNRIIFCFHDEHRRLRKVLQFVYGRRLTVLLL